MFHAVAMALCLFLWAYSIPLLLVLVAMGSPFALLFLAMGAGLSKLRDDQPICTSRLRTWFNHIPWHQWFDEASTVTIPGDRHYLIASHPHQLFCLGALICVHFRPKSRTLFAVAPLIFHVPFIGWLAAHLGCVPADKGSLQAALKVSSVLLVPGGVPEVVMFERGEMYTERYGMFRLGVPILPLVTTSQHYYVPKAPLYRLRLLIAKTFRVPIIFPWVFGWYGTWLPKRHALVVKQLEVSENVQREEYYKKIENAMYKSVRSYS